MPKLHIIYDPTDKLITTSEFNEKLKLKVSVLSVADDLPPEDIDSVAMQLASLLLQSLIK